MKLSSTIILAGSLLCLRLSNARLCSSFGSEDHDGRELISALPDCTACNEDCCKWRKKWGMPYYGCSAGCLTRRTGCRAAKTAFNSFVGGIEAACNNDPNRMDKRDLVEDAKNILDDHGVYSKPYLDSIDFRFCNLGAVKTSFSVLGKKVVYNPPDGMALSRNKVIFKRDWRSATKEALALLMAHEVKHIEQYRRWGTDGFGCRYVKELLRGNGSGAANAVEKEAYDFGREVAIKLALGPRTPDEDPPEESSIKALVEKIHVDRTPNDPGSSEEWRQKFELIVETTPPIRKTAGRHFNPRDNGRSGTYNIGVNLDSGTFQADKVDWPAIGSVEKPYRLKVWGTEDDQWPDSDDKLPTCFSPYQNYEGNKTKEVSFDCSGHGRYFRVYVTLTEE